MNDEFKIDDRVTVLPYGLPATVLKIRRRVGGPTRYGVVFDHSPDFMFWLDWGLTPLSDTDDYISPHYFQD